MCFGKPKAPKIVYQGPSDADVSASNDALEAFRRTTAENTRTFQDTITRQIETANTATANLMKEIATAKAGSGSGVENKINEAPYAITTEEDVKPEDAQTTTAISKKKKKPSTLKIATGGLSASAGTGVNYGV